jgi:hypothetical protein
MRTKTRYLLMGVTEALEEDKNTYLFRDVTQALDEDNNTYLSF